MKSPDEKISILCLVFGGGAHPDYWIKGVPWNSGELLVRFIKLLVLLQATSGFTSGFERKTSGLLLEVSGKRKFLKSQTIDFQ